MGGSGSGRRAISQTKASIAPSIGENEDEIGHWVDQLAAHVANGDVDPRVADTLKDLARTKLAAIRQKSEREKVEELHDILRRAEALRAEGLAHEEAVRQHREDPLVGRWTVTKQKGREVFINEGDAEK